MKGLTYPDNNARLYSTRCVGDRLALTGRARISRILSTRFSGVAYASSQQIAQPGKRVFACLPLRPHPSPARNEAML